MSHDSFSTSGANGVSTNHASHGEPVHAAAESSGEETMAVTNGDHPASTVVRWQDEALWHESAPETAVQGFLTGDGSAGWKAWKKHLLRRKQPRPLAKLWDGKHSILTWGAGPLQLSAGLQWLLDLLGRPSVRRDGCAAMISASAEQWLAETATPDVGRMPAASNGHAGETAATDIPGDDLEPLAWAHLLAALPNLFTREVWLGLLERLTQLASATRASPAEAPLRHQWLAGELPLTLSYLFGELQPCRQLRAAAAEALSKGMDELLDGEGMPQARYLALLRPLVASWTRCRLLGDELAEPIWSDAAEQQFPLAVREAWRWSRPDGTQALGPLFGEASASSPAELDDAATEKAKAKVWRRDFRWLADVASQLASDKSNRRLARLLMASRRKQAAPAAKEKHWPPASVYSEWAELAVLRSDWSNRSTRVSVGFHGDRVQVELSEGAELLMSGLWIWSVAIDGQARRPTTDWREVCWVSDADCDYLELEIELGGQVKLQRQMLLARKDQFLFLADAVLGSGSHRVDYQSQLPLVDGVRAEPATESTELVLTAAKSRALVLPLSLSEWRIEARAGSLAADDAALSLSQTGVGAAMYSPLWIDLAKRRADKPFTWRQLTVAEHRANVSPDTAVGYRVQFGARQWLVYRSLTPPANRTVLGQNLSTDFFLGRFGLDGETETILEIE